MNLQSVNSKLNDEINGLRLKLEQATGNQNQIQESYKLKSQTLE